MKKLLLILLLAITFQVDAQAPLDFQASMQPIPSAAAFRDPGYFVWCGTMVRGDDGKYHLFYSRWKTADGFESWVTASEIAHAIGDTPTGPFVFHDVTLPPRGPQFWDGLVTHNPTVHRFGKKYYLYYTGNTGDGIIQPTLNWTHRNNQRVGVAVADRPEGPWTRTSKPLIDVSPDPKAPDSLCMANPSITQGPNGVFYLLYKAVGREKPLPFGGPVVHLMATSTSPTGPFYKDPRPLFTVAGNNFPFEDPFLWFSPNDQTFYVIMKDNKGVVLDTGESTLVLYESKNAVDWHPAAHPLVSRLELHWKDRPTQPVERLERPQLVFDPHDRPIALIVAIKDAGKESYNVRIPLTH